MDASRRREQILAILRASSRPVSAAALAAETRVSRQIIVGDIALLRASGTEIQATPRGYLLQSRDEEQAGCLLYTIACRHGADQLAEELYTVVDNGGGLLDVTVEHPVYGQLCGKLHIFSRHDADLFMDTLARNHAETLCNLTGNLHLHTLACRTEEDYRRILAQLDKKGILFPR